MLTTDLLALMAALAVAAATLAFTVSGQILLERRRLRARMERLIVGGQPAEEERKEPLWRRGLDAPGRWIMEQLDPRIQVALRSQVERAGSPFGLRAEHWLGVRLLLAPVGIFIAVLFLRTGASPLTVLGVLLSLAVALAAVDAWLIGQGAARRRASERALPTLVDLLQLCLAAGMGFENAIATIAERMRGPLADELQRYLTEVNELGRSRTEALLAIGHRTGSQEALLFADSVAQASVLGSGLLTIVDAQARLLRQARRRQAEAAAQRAPVKMMLPMTAFILPVLMLIVLGPVILRLYTRAQGS